MPKLNYEQFFTTINGIEEGGVAINVGYSGQQKSFIIPFGGGYLIKSDAVIGFDNGKKKFNIAFPSSLLKKEKERSIEKGRKRKRNRG